MTARARLLDAMREEHRVGTEHWVIGLLCCRQPGLLPGFLRRRHLDLRRRFRLSNQRCARHHRRGRARLYAEWSRLPSVPLDL